MVNIFVNYILYELKHELNDEMEKLVLNSVNEFTLNNIQIYNNSDYNLINNNINTNTLYFRTDVLVVLLTVLINSNKSADILILSKCSVEELLKCVLKAFFC